MNSEVQQTTTLAAGAGGLLWAMASAFAVLFAPTPPDRRSVARACAEAAASIVAALIGGWFVAPAICVHLHITEIETVSLTGLCVGLVFWRAVPILNIGLLKIVSSKLQQGSAP